MSAPDDRPPGGIYIIAAIAFAIVISIIVTAPGRNPDDATTAVVARSLEH